MTMLVELDSDNRASLRTLFDRYPCLHGVAAAEERLKVALARGDFTAIRSLRRAPEEPDDTCWLAGEEWWLSTAPVPKPSH
jgi:hypothetical protein